MDSNLKERDSLMIFTFSSLALALVSTITYMLYTIITSGSFLNHIFSIVSVCILVVFSILMVFTGFFIENNKSKIFISVASLFLAFYSIFQIIAGVTSPRDLVLDFTNYDIKDVVVWAKKRDVLVEQDFKYSDTIKEFHVIKQNVKVGTPVKKVKKIKVTVSNGIDPEKKAPVTNMVGWKLDDVIKFIDEYHLTNVNINFEFSNSVEKDIIISQDTIREIKRNEPVTLTSSLGKENELDSVTLENLIGLDTFHALVYLGRNHLNYSIVYSYNKEKDGTVIKQNLKKWTVIGKDRKEEIIITIAKENEVTVPNLKNMSKQDISDWANSNHIKIEFDEAYDDTIKSGKVISFSAIEGVNIETGTNIKVVLSKGSIKMIEFNGVDSFKKWAEEYEIAYSIEYEYNDDVEQGKLIYSSHTKGQVIKNNDTIRLVISEGGNTTVPDLTNLTRTEAINKCKESKLNCIFKQNGDGIVIKQSMRSGSTVPTNTTVTLTLED